jgi:membrane protein involved in colicin uptake
LPSAAAAPAADASPLIEFNKRFREAGEAKDAAARDAKAARKAAGKAAAKKMLAERADVVAARKAANRAAEAAAEKAMLDSLNGESWGRVVSLVDIHGHTAAASPAAAAAEKKGKAAGASLPHWQLIRKTSCWPVFRAAGWRPRRSGTGSWRPPAGSIGGRSTNRLCRR